MDEKKTTIEVEINSLIDYEDVRELVKKICEDHEGKRNLHIKIKFG